MDNLKLLGLLGSIAILCNLGCMFILMQQMKTLKNWLGELQRWSNLATEEVNKLEQKIIVLEDT